MTWHTILRKPSALLPLVMSLAALCLVLGFLTIYGIVQNEDEGTAARLFQLLLAAQLPLIGYFGIRWVPEEPRKGMIVLLLQVLAIAAALAPVVVLEL